MLIAVTSAEHGSLHCSTHPIMITHFVALQPPHQKRITKNVPLLVLHMFSCVHRLGTQPLTKGERIMWGYTIIGRDGGEAYTSEPEYESEMEAYKAGDLTLCDMNEGSMEVWEDQ